MARQNQETVIDGRYRLLSRIGAGGMGTVYEGKDLVLKKNVAVKILLPAAQDKAYLRFHQEAKMAARLSHPNIVNVLDFGQSEAGDLYLVMDFLDGESLADLIKRDSPVELPEAIAIFRQICSGLGNAHKQNILHRDVKPSNIMLAREPDGSVQVKIVDFGLAKVEGVEQSITTTGNQIGSPYYMSPEQSLDRSLDHRSDIYSLGCLMFETLTGQTPFYGESLLETLRKQAEEVPRRIDEVDSERTFPDALVALVAKTLEKEPSDRYQSAGELEEALKSIGTTSAEGSVQAVGDAVETTGGATSLARSGLLGTVLVAGLACIVFGWQTLIDTKERRASDERAYKKSVASEKRHKSDILADVEDMFTDKLKGPMRGRLSAHKDFADGDIASVLRFENQPQLSLAGSQVTGRGLSRLKKLPLTDLDLSDTGVTDEAMVELESLTGLRILRLDRDRIGDSGIKHLAALKKLQHLHLQSTQVTDSGLETLGRLPALALLDLTDCARVTDNGLESLSGKKTLKALYLVRCENVSEAAISRFREQNKHCSVFLQDETTITRKERKPDERFALSSKNENFRRFLKYEKEMYDEEFRTFFRNPDNWSLGKEDIEKIKNRKILKCLNDPDYMSDPVVKRFWLDDSTWRYLSRRVNEAKDTYEIILGSPRF